EGRQHDRRRAGVLKGAGQRHHEEGFQRRATEAFAPVEVKEPVDRRRSGSLKARLCVAGRHALYAFLEAHGVAFERCGKLIVATEESEIGALEHLRAQAEINGVEGISWLSGAEARALEPELNAVAALASPQSGIFDSH